jgi:hypothetical protein
LQKRLGGPQRRCGCCGEQRCRPVRRLVTTLTELLWPLAMLQTCIREVRGSNLSRDTAFRGFLQSLQPNSGMIPRLGHCHSLPNPSEFIIHHSSYSYHEKRYDLDTDKKFWKELIAYFP